MSFGAWQNDLLLDIIYSGTGKPYSSPLICFAALLDVLIMGWAPGSRILCQSTNSILWDLYCHQAMFSRLSGLIQWHSQEICVYSIKVWTQAISVHHGVEYIWLCAATVVVFSPLPLPLPFPFRLGLSFLGCGIRCSHSHSCGFVNWPPAAAEYKSVMKQFLFHWLTSRSCLSTLGRPLSTITRDCS